MNSQLRYHQFNSSSVFEFLEQDRLAIEHPTSYFPLLQKYTKRKLELSDQIQWFHRYKLLHVNRTTPTTTEITDESEISHRMFQGKVLDMVNRKKIYKGIFFKLSHILNPALIVTNYYGENCQRWTIDKLQTAKRLTNKLYSYHNSAYIESFACLLTSRLVEKNVSPHFPLLFGIYSGTAKKMYSDYTEEYFESKDLKWFKQGLQEKRFGICKKTFEDEDDCSASKEDIFLHPKSESENEEESITSDDDQEEELNDEEKELFMNDEKEEEEDEEIENDSVVEENEIEVETVKEENTESVKEEDIEKLVIDTPVEEEVKEVGELAMLNLDDLSQIDVGHETESMTSQCQYLLETYNVPVQIMAVERFHTIMEEEMYEDIEGLEEYYLLSVNDLTKKKIHQRTYKEKIREFDDKWFAITAQIVMALISMQHHFHMVHNDLHNQNVMLHATKKEFLYYKVGQQYYQIPTYGYIIKIIDFGRATFTFRNKEIMGDVFALHEDAGEQYTYGNYGMKKGENEVIKPNRSFDLCRLACSITQDGDYDEDEDIYQDSSFFQLMIEWTKDDQNEPVTRYEGFDLYKMIAREVNKLIPVDVITREPFTRYLLLDRPSTPNIWIYHTC